MAPGALAAGVLAALVAGSLGRDPATGRGVTGPAECGDCHEDELATWEVTAHARGWTELARTETARSLVAALGIRRIKRDERCVGCHFLAADVDGEIRGVAGVACESCHGAAAEWIDVHWDHGPDGATRETESPEHRAERWRRSEEAGLLRPSRVHSIADRCYGCHVVTGDALLAAGHPAPRPLDLVAGTQGELRHNYLRGEGDNAEAPPERRAVLRALGRLLDAQHSLAALASAPGTGPSRAALRARVRAVLAAASEEPDPYPEVAAALRSVAALDLEAASKDELEELARRLGEAARDHGRRHGSAGLP